MAHGIFVCLEHKCLMHGARNKGIHSNKHHGKNHLKLEEEGLIIEIGTCAPAIFHPCPDSHDRQATEQEIQLALSFKDKQIREIKERKERWAKGDYS